MKNILVVNVNWVGDVVFSSPVFRALREKYPDARISCMAVPRVKPILESIKDIDEIIVYDEKGRHRWPWAKLAIVARLRREGFDVAFLLHRSLTRALFLWLAQIPQRVGYDDKGRGLFLTQKVEKMKEVVHRSDFYLNVIESFGVEIKDRRTSLNIDDVANQELKQILKDHGLKAKESFVVINPGGNWDLKRWPVNNFHQLIKVLHSETKIVVSGALKDEKLAAEIVAGMGPEVISLAGKTNLKQVMALMQRARLVISADSGPLHIASSLGTPTIGIFGPTREEITGLRGRGATRVLQHDVGCNRRACYFLNCPDNVCMQSVSVSDVLKAYKQIQSS